MPVLSLCIGAQPSLFLPPRFNHRPPNGQSRKPTRVSMQFQKQIIFPSLKALGTGAAVRNGFGFAKRKNTSLFACNALLLERAKVQTRTVTRAPTHVITKSPNLHDGGTGFPPRHNGGGGGGGGGGESFSGGFLLFGFLLFMGYWKDLEGKEDNSHSGRED